MKNRTNIIAIVIALVATIVFAQALAALQAPAAGQRGQAQGAAGQGGQSAQGAPAARGGGRGQQNLGPAGPVPRLASGKPDLSGHWNNPYAPNMAAGGRGGAGGAVDPATRMPLAFDKKGTALTGAPLAGTNNPKTFDLPYTEWGLNQWASYDPVKNGDYAGSCLPFGMSRSINSPHGVQIIHSADALAFLWEQNTWFHWVPTTADFKWPADLPETWNGVSTGHWDGDTLIIETAGFNGYTRLDTTGHPHSKEMKMTNTFLRTDSRTMQHTVTIHDPKTYTKDWMNVRTWTLKQATDVIMEYSCEENNTGIYDGAITRWKPPTDIN